MSYDPRYVTNPDGTRHGEVVGAERRLNGKLLIEWTDQSRTWHPRIELLRDTERAGTVDTGQDAPVPLRVACTITHDWLRPNRAHTGDAGLDLRSTAPVTVPAQGRVTVPTGIGIAIPAGFVGYVTPRSGLAASHGITVLNAPGIIDSGYRGEIKVILFNTSDRAYNIQPSDRIAQLIIAPVAQVELFVVATLPASVRAEGGFGSTGR